MARLIYSAAALADLERLTDFLLESDPAAAERTAELIEEALNILRRHPHIGRPAEEGLRELIISRGRSGHVALYQVVDDLDLVFVLRIRHQREAG